MGIGSSNHFDCPLYTGHDSKCRSEKDDGFVRVTFKTEKGERHSQVLQNMKASEYRLETVHYVVPLA